MFTFEARLTQYEGIVQPFKKLFKVSILKPNSHPKFTSPLPTTIVLQKTHEPQSWSFGLPAFFDEDPADEVTLTAELDNARGFMKLTDDYNITVSDVSSRLFSSAIYLLKFTLDDSKAKTVYSTMLMVFDAPPIVVEDPVVEEPVEVCEWAIKVPDFETNVEYVSGSGPLMVSWKRFTLDGKDSCTKDIPIAIQLKATWQDDRFSKETDWL